MKKILITLIVVLTLGTVGATAQNLRLWLTTEGAGVHLNTGGRHQGPPPEFFYGDDGYYRYPRHSKKYYKKMKKRYKKQMKAQEKYYKARHKAMKKHYKAMKIFFDDDDDD